MKFLHVMSNARPYRMAALIVVLIAALLILPTAYAVIPSEPNSAPAADDGGPWEVGAEAAGGSLSSYAYSEASYLYNRLTSCSWTGRFLYSTSQAWEEDFKRAAAGGTESSYLDTVDLMFYVGHGSPSAFTFDNYHDDTTLTPSDCNYAWGDGDNEWVALTSCQVLADSNRSSWAACMAGTHLILGFITNAGAYMGTATQGYAFADNLCNGWTVTGAWFKACDLKQVGAKTRVLAEETACFNDRPSYSTVCSDAWDYDYYWQDHTCGSGTPYPLASAATGDSAVLNSTMPVFRTRPLSLAEAQTNYTHLGSVFTIPPVAVASAMQPDSDVWRSASQGRELEMDSASGQYDYYDTNNLWTTAAVERAFMARAAAITADDARAIADAFLQQNGLMPSDARFREVVADTVASGVVSGTTISTVDQVQPTAWQVIYNRVVSTTLVSAAGGVTTQEFTVVGPGAQLKVYVPPTTALAANLTTPVVGTLGGWHRVEQPTVSAAGVESVPILTPQQIYTLHEQLEGHVVINTPPIVADGRQILSHSVAYWEEGLAANQSELLPVYDLIVSYTNGGVEVAVGHAYIPANPTYMRPWAAIASAPSGQLRVGQQVTLAAADATKTLAELGFDASLNFALGSGDYIYDWFLNSVAEANRIGSGRTFNYTVKPDAAYHAGQLNQTIILRVTDIGSADQRTTTANVALSIQPRVLLPVIFK